MAQKHCPRCKVRVHPKKDKSLNKWQYSKRKKVSYVCTACEAELIAKGKKLPPVYTESAERMLPANNGVYIPPKVNRRRKPKLCPLCKEVTFLIGVAVYPDKQKPLVCSKPCKRKYIREQEDYATSGTSG